MIIFNIILYFIIFYLITFTVTVIAKNIHKYIVKYLDRIKNIEIGIIAKPKPKKIVNKKWNESLGVWEIE